MKNNPVSYILHIGLYILSYIIPKKKGLIILGAGRGNSFKGNTKYLFLYTLRNRPSLSPIWVTRSTHVYSLLKKKSLPVESLGSLRTYWKLLRADCICIEQSAKDVAYAGVLLGRFRIVQTWHGTPLKKIAADTFEKPSSLGKRIYRNLLLREFAGYSLIPSPSEEVSPLLSSGLGGNENVCVTGYPRNDILLNPHKDLFIRIAETTPEIDTNRTVVAYIPTFRDSQSSLSPFTAEEWEKLDVTLQQMNAIFLVKKHPFQKELSIPKDVQHIYDVSDTVDDLQELLPFVDVLITDYSSVYFDYMITNRPVIFYAYDLDEYLSQSRAMYYSYEDAIPGPIASNGPELIHLLDTVSSWFESTEYQKKYGRIRNRFNTYTDSCSSERIMNHLYPHGKKLSS